MGVDAWNVAPERRQMVVMQYELEQWVLETVPVEIVQRPQQSLHLELD